VSDPGVVIVGGGLVGARTARALRSQGFGAPIRIVAGEDAWPYDRPPLSKEFLAGEAGEQDICLLDVDACAELDIELMRGRRAASLDLDRRELLLADGVRVPFAQLVAATGAAPRTLPQLDGLGNVFTLRDVGDARALRDAFTSKPRVLVVGGGFIGLETACAAHARGCQVTVIEAGAQPMSAVLGATLGKTIGDWHESHGVRLLRERSVTHAEREGETLRVTLSDGSTMTADVVVLAVGVHAEVDWLGGTALHCEDGVPCDINGRTAVEGVFAAGDVARPLVHGRSVRLGHWTPANDMARRVAGVLCGAEDDERELDDYFWSDQFGARLQLVGSIDADSEMVVETGSIEDSSFVASCHVDGKPSAVFAMNRPRDFLRARLAMQAVAV
jgi:3-phenylpropionate/trans-cinnamate dioxygenase ferredoxin reductase subunit